jgi:uncharacterized membrane protein
MRDHRDDNDWYRYGVYFNKQDDRIFVPKQDGYSRGFTLNFARPEVYLILTLIILLGVVGSGTLK